MNPYSSSWNFNETEFTQCRSSAESNVIESIGSGPASDRRTGSGETFALEYVTQMSATCCTSDLNAMHTQSRVFMSAHSSRNR